MEIRKAELRNGNVSEWSCKGWQQDGNGMKCSIFSCYEVYANSVLRVYSIRQIEKKILDEILGSSVYDSRIRWSREPGSVVYLWLYKPGKLASFVPLTKTPL